MANYHVLRIDSLLESLTLCNAGKGFIFQLDITEEVTAQSGDYILGYLTAPIDEIRYIFEVESASGNSMILKKTIEVSVGLQCDFSVIEELQPATYQKDFFTISRDLFKAISSQLCCSSIENGIKSSKYSGNTATQTIYYGCPGSGKSYEVKRIAEGENGEKIIKYSDGTTNVFRTTFHPDYDYATFVGCYKPVKNEENELDYRFVPQVFTNAYIQALRHTDDPIYLIIEEINRGNCAQIFGDLFQLLDRTNGESDYSIIPDSELAKYLKGQGVPHNELCLPNNLHIYATMNTSDQSLFPMDSAFKRRWAMIYKPIDYTHKKASTFTITIGDGAETITYPWTGFLMMVNDKIINATDSEDKQMGEFFIKDSIKEKDFINKVMFYIWNDVCKDLYNPRRVAPQFFMRINKPLENEKDYFTFAELFSHRNKSSRLLKEFINYLEAEFIEHHKELELDPKQPINWETVKEKLNNQ